MRIANGGSLRSLTGRVISDDNHPSRAETRIVPLASSPHPRGEKRDALDKIRIRGIISYTRMHDSCVVRAWARRKETGASMYLTCVPVGVRDPFADLRSARTFKVTCYFDRYGMHVTYSLSLILQDLSSATLGTALKLV